MVLPGAAWVEKDGCYTNDQGRVQAASKAINPPGEAVEDWQILTSVAAALGLPFSYESAAAVRADLAAALARNRRMPGCGSDLQPPGQRRDLAAGEQSLERWKWDVMYQDLPPVKGHNVQMEHAAKPSVIPLRLVTELGPAGD